MSGNDKFCSYPDKFLMENAIIVPPNEGVPAGVYYFSIGHAGLDFNTFESIPMKTTDDNIAWLLKLHRSRPNCRAIKGYWCPYIPNSTGVITLGNEAIFMFTAGLTGCSVGFGAPSADGALRVAHANVQADSSDLQLASQRKLLAERGMAWNYHPDKYRNDGVGQSTIFGIKGITYWRIFARKFELNTPKLKDLGVTRVYG